MHTLNSVFRAGAGQDGPSGTPFTGSSLGIMLSLAPFAAWVYGCARGEMQIGLLEMHPVCVCVCVRVCVCVCVRPLRLSVMSDSP